MSGENCSADQWPLLSLLITERAASTSYLLGGASSDTRCETREDAASLLKAKANVEDAV
jgi:hypothetical protein